MTDLARPRRSVLYLPGSNARALAKARTVPADALILDLEDAVAPDGKAAARDRLADAVAAGGFGGRELIVRINGLDTDWGEDDLRMACAAGPDAILVPKVAAPSMIEEVEALITRWRAPETTGIWAMMETPRGVLHAEAIAAATPRLDALVMGTNDLAKELGAGPGPDRQPMLTALGLCLLAARAYGLAILDGVHGALDDEAGLRAACLQGRALGFDGKTLIHPRQIAAANEAFAPAAAELDLARRQIEAFEAAVAAGAGIAVVDGAIVENLHVETARRRLAMAAAIAARDAADG